MNDNDFAMDALNRLRAQTKAETDKLGYQMADSIMDIWCKDPLFQKSVVPGLAQCPTFLYADIFNAMARRMTERCQSETMWYNPETGTQDAQ